MLLRYYSYRLEFRRVFHIAAGARSGTDAVYVELEQDGQIGYGEAALPPYLPENIKSVTHFLDEVMLPDSIFDKPLTDIIKELDESISGSYAAKAAMDIALHDLYGKLTGLSVKSLLGLGNTPSCLSTYTLGISNKVIMEGALKDALPFRLIKLKLGGEHDKQAIEDLQSITDKPFCVDVNQGWTDLSFAIDMAHWLHEKGAFLLEQPLPKTRLDDMALLTEQSPIPIIADESVWRLADLQKVLGACHGINIKLMKSGGLLEALRMINEARRLDMKILLGCMSESSCAVTAAAQLAGLCDWADLDGPYLIANDPFKGMWVEDGYVRVPDGAGLGVVKR